jgi:hypothetical protein|tara:strand:+ start:360 stop:620 length:261 start_codon:yes stop_codon:yes gene_type:complete
MIDSYHIDGYNVLHTYIDDKKHVTISNVTSDKEAERLISEMNKGLIKDTYSNWFGKDEESKEDVEVVIENTESLDWYENWKKENFK